MRLIDVDKLIDNLDAMIPDYDYSDTSMGIATAIQEVGRMAFYEEVEAIPVEWVKKWLNETEFRDRIICFDIRDMLEDWEEENEPNKKNTSQID